MIENYRTRPNRYYMDNFPLPKPVVRKLSGNATLYSWKISDSSILNVRFLFYSGKLIEAKKGLAHLTTHMLIQGTKKRSWIDIHEILDNDAISWDIECYYDFFSIDICCTDKHLSSLIALIREMLSESIFCEERLNYQRTILINQLRNINKRIQYVASKNFKRLMFDIDNPYGYTIEEKDIVSITRNDIIDFYINNILDSCFDVLIAGDTTFKDIDIFNSLARDINKKSDTDKRIPSIYNNSKLRHYYAQRENGIQASLCLGIALPSSVKANDYFSFRLLNTLLGGYFGSRIMQNLRENKGYSYGIGSNLVLTKDVQYLVIKGDVKIDKSFLSIEEIGREIQRFIVEPIDSKELEKAVQYIIGSYLVSFDNPFVIVDIFQRLLLLNLSFTHYDDMSSILSSISADHIQSLAYSYLDFKKMIKVVVS